MMTTIAYMRNMISDSTTHYNHLGMVMLTLRGPSDHQILMTRITMIVVTLMINKYWLQIETIFPSWYNMYYYNNRLYSDGKYPVTGRRNWLFIRIVNHLKLLVAHHDVIRWKHFPRYWPLVRGFRRSPVNSPHKGQWRGALMFSVIWAWINGWVGNGDAGDLRRHRAHNDVIVMCWYYTAPYVYVNIDWIYDLWHEGSKLWLTFMLFVSQ